MHLLHSPAMLNLYGTFRGSELSSNLFIEHSRNYQLHDLAFAGDQLIESRARSLEIADCSLRWTQSLAGAC